MIYIYRHELCMEKWSKVTRVYFNAKHALDKYGSDYAK